MLITSFLQRAASSVYLKTNYMKKEEKLRRIIKPITNGTHFVEFVNVHKESLLARTTHAKLATSAKCARKLSIHLVHAVRFANRTVSFINPHALNNLNEFVLVSM